MASVAVWPLVKRTFREWNEDGAPRLAAALAYYTIFSLAPILVIVVAVAGLAFGAEEVRGAIVQQMRGMLGDSGGELVGGLLEQASKPKDGVLAMAIALATLLFGASGLFAQLQSALNTVWEVKPKTGRGLIGVFKDRFLSFTMVVGVGFLLLVSLVLSAALQALQAFAEGRVAQMAPLFQVLGAVLGVALTTLLFAMLFKFLPDVKLAWNDVWTGALATAVLFTAGEHALGAYIGRGALGSAYGAAGSLAILLIWVYYSAQIILFGAELTQVYARMRGAWVEPKDNAEAAPAGTGPLAAPARPPAVPPRLAARAPLASRAAARGVRPLEPEVVLAPARPPAFLGGVALGIVVGFVNQRLRRRFWATGSWR
ncbi:MAG TPA: YihY/virulence factor BrkB family protein [Vicinamibacteria bacterium]|nr:YihY/virulence factor BrkB family protein [Vicinamibacteria bacterium]